MVERGDELERVVAEVVGSGQVRPAGAGRVVAALARRVRTAGPRALVDGSFLTDLLSSVLPRLDLRGAEALRQAYPDLEPDEVAAELIRSASVLTAGIGAACGALASGAELTGAGLLTVPLPVLADTVLSALVEMRLVAELHAAMGAPLPQPGSQRAAALLRAWAAGRGVTDAAGSGGGLDVVAAMRGEVGRLVRRRITQRAGRSLVALAPALTGAVAAAELNRRATRSLGQRVLADLGGTRRRRWRH